VAIVVVGIAIHELSKPSNHVDTKAPFVNPTTSSTTTTVSRKAASNFTWAIYGDTNTRTRDYTGDPSLSSAKFKTAWTFGGNALLEFPATIWGNNLYFLDGGATVKRVNIKTGKQIWLKHVGKRSASTPALDVKDKLLFVSVLSTIGTATTDFDGLVQARSMLSGKIKWTFPVSSGTESSPIVVGNSVYFGSQGGTLYSVNAETGHLNWSLTTTGPVKAGPAYFGGDLYFGNYGGTFYSVNAKTGKIVWSDNAGGEFYSTPAIAFGRVYVGNNNGDAYSFVLSSGTEAWSVGVGGYAYSGPAVAATPGLGPTVYIGSYGDVLHALNARTGATEWTASVPTAISGSATDINNVVYVSTVYSSGTYGFNATTGKQVFHFPDGRYTSVVADPNALFLMGRYVLYKLVPTK
jgi:outer membrane protein assembly factor BamB